MKKFCPCNLLRNLAYLITITLCSSCITKIDPQIQPNFPHPVLKKTESLSPFKELSSEEKKSDWGKEYKIALHFAHEGDFYRAITGFKRAAILLPAEQLNREREIHYHILLSYYQAHKYLDTIHSFEKGPLQTVDYTFPAFYDLLLLLKDSYEQINQKEKAEKLFQIIQAYSPEEAQKIDLSTALREANFPKLEAYIKSNPSETTIQPILQAYKKEYRNPRKAQTLNACLPGLGYYYVGQKQSALTAFLLNTTFIAAAYHFFHHGHTAAGLITTSFELGWYIGGINGAGLAAKEFNERLYEKHGYKALEKEKLFPIFFLGYNF